MDEYIRFQNQPKEKWMKIDQTIKTCIKNKMMFAFLKTIPLRFGDKVPNADYGGCKAVALRIVAEYRNYRLGSDEETNTQRTLGNKVKLISTALRKKCRRAAYHWDMEAFNDQYFSCTRLHDGIEYLVLAGVIQNKADAKHIRNFLRIMHSVDQERAEDPRTSRQITADKHNKRKRLEEL
jgi:hypothetical protein